MSISHERIIEMLAVATKQSVTAVKAWFTGASPNDVVLGWSSLDAFVAQIEEELCTGKGSWIKVDHDRAE